MQTVINRLREEEGLAPLPFVELPRMAKGKARVWLKKEWLDPESKDPLRSIKRKPAFLLFQDLAEKRYLEEGKILISATSGNFGIEVGLLAARQEIPFLAVVPAVIPEYNLKVMTALGINVLKTKEQETCPREFTVFFARGYAHEFHHRLVNVEQYYSFLNPLAHTLTTAREIVEQLNGHVDWVVASVGSCGTISGILQFLAATGAKTKALGVQPPAGQGVPGTHIIKGDCKWSPENYSPVILPGSSIVEADNVDAYAFTAWLWRQGIPAGPSTGMALARAYNLLKQGAQGEIVVISPDSNFKYGDLIRERLSALREEILARYPELELSETIERYISHLEEKAGLEWTLSRVRKCYPAREEGRLFAVEDIEEIVTGRARLAGDGS